MRLRGHGCEPTKHGGSALLMGSNRRPDPRLLRLACLMGCESPRAHCVHPPSPPPPLCVLCTVAVAKVPHQDTHGGWCAAEGETITRGSRQAVFGGGGSPRGELTRGVLRAAAAAAG